MEMVEEVFSPIRFYFNIRFVGERDKLVKEISDKIKRHTQLGKQNERLNILTT